ncbi:MAG: amidase, partial [Proteobacteria bacterium]|nr:amidase [Pseudomonadota bacterium]
MDRELCYMSAIEMEEAVRKQDISCTEIVNTILDRIEKINPKINAYCTVLTEDAQRAAKEADLAVKQGKRLGPLHGVPVS